MSSDSWHTSYWPPLNDTPIMNTTVGHGTLSPMPLIEQTSVQYGGVTLPEETPKLAFMQDTVNKNLRTAVPPFLLLFGTFGNVMTVLVMRASRNKMGDPSMCVYFPSLAVCDQITLTVGLGRQWIKTISLWDFRNVHVVVCKLHKFSVFAVGRMSTWILVSVTSQRVLTVLWPLRQKRTSTTNRAKAVVFIIVLACCVFDIGILVMYSILKRKSGETKCSPRASYYQVMVYPWLNIVTGALLPLSILVINNVILGFKVRQSIKAFREIAGTQQAGTLTRRTAALSITLMVTSLGYILLKSPIPLGYIVLDLNQSSASSDPVLEAKLNLMDAVLDLMWYCNSAINFYLYFLTGPNFRQTAIRVLCSCIIDTPSTVTTSYASHTSRPIFAKSSACETQKTSMPSNLKTT